MDREISFRGKRLDNGEWVYGSLIQMDEGGSQSFIFPFYKYASSLACNQIVSMFMVAVDPTTVGQFTGRCDKNGVKIFEGDVMQLCSATYPCTVYWDGIGWAWKMNGKRRDIDLTREKMAVIGNIHDNQSW